MPSATARDFQRAAARLGFELVRTRGSHERWVHADGRIVVIPVHGNRPIGSPLFQQMLRQLRVTLEEFRRIS
jgi:predicted RNA binding protein YcfA (HicA-like mRNA interferase family)